MKSKFLPPDPSHSLAKTALMIAKVTFKEQKKLFLVSFHQKHVNMLLETTGLLVINTALH